MHEVLVQFKTGSFKITDASFLMRGADREQKGQYVDWFATKSNIKARRPFKQTSGSFYIIHGHRLKRTPVERTGQTFNQKKITRERDQLYATKV